MSTVISVENVSKAYRLGVIGGGALREDLARWWARARGKPDPLLKIGEKDHGNRSGETVWALRDVSFEVKQGEVLGIIGRNGAGKSTLLKILSQVTAPTSGHVKVKGRIASLLEVGTGFHPELTGRENIFLNGAILGMTKSEIVRKLDEIISFAEVEQYIDTPVKRYSSGMYVRLAFAVAAHLEPEILVVDEVLAVGDAAFQRRCLGKMGDVARDGRTVLFVSHNMAAVDRLCRSATWLDRGRIRAIGSADSVVSTYLAAGRAAPGERRWEDGEGAPGNQSIRLRAVRVLDANGRVSSTLDRSSPFYVEIEYDIFHPLHSMQVGFWILTSEGVVVFVAGDRENLEWLDRQRQPGTYVSQCKIPGALLNATTYMLNAGVNLLAEGIVIMQADVVQFDVTQTAVPLHSRHGGWTPPGVLCLSLEWTISRRDGRHVRDWQQGGV